MSQSDIILLSGLLDIMSRPDYDIDRDDYENIDADDYFYQHIKSCLHDLDYEYLFLYILFLGIKTRVMMIMM